MAVDLTNYVSSQTPATNTIAQGAGADALTSGQSNLDTSYQTFLKLLTAQLKNQDPTSPLDTNAFTQQLVQMTGVQQQLLSNKLLQQLVNQKAGGDVNDGINLIGKTVTASTANATLKNGQANWTYDLDKTASQATLTVTDAGGAVVWTGPAPDLSAGSHGFTWNGKTSGGQTAADGTYTLSAHAQDANGSTVAATSSVTGVVTSVRQSNGQVLIKIGGVETPLLAVTGVSATATASNTASPNGSSTDAGSVQPPT